MQKSRGDKPPTLAVGIAGHRWNKLDSQNAFRVAAELARLFSAIDAGVRAFSRQAAQGRSLMQPCIWVLSGLAEGADQLAFQSAPRDWLRVAILPFPKARYLLDFAPEHATGGIDRRSEFETALGQADLVFEISDAPDEIAAYEIAGDRMLMASDLLIAVWDGKQSDGRGGTETVVRKAARTMPVIWINSADSQAPTQFLSTDEKNANLESATIEAITLRLQSALISPAKHFPSHLF